MKPVEPVVRLHPLLLRRFVATLGLMWFVGLLWVFVLRSSFPLELEWMEGGTLLHALRLSRGEGIYVAPSFAFVPYLYPPLYPAIVALVSSVAALDFSTARGLSIVAFVAACGLAWMAVRGEGKPRAHAAAAVGLFCAGYVFCYRFYDLARADMLFLALVAGAVVVLRHARSHRRALAAAVLGAAAFWTKQTASFVLLAAALGAVFAARFALRTFVPAVALFTLGGLALANLVTEGWAFTYLVELHQSHAFNHARFWVKSWGMLAHAAPWIVVLVVLAAITTVRGCVHTSPPLRVPPGVAHYGCVVLGATFVSVLGYSTQFAESNAFMPAVYFGAVFVMVWMPEGGGPERWALAAVGAQLVFSLVLEPRYQAIQDRGLAGVLASYRLQRLDRVVPEASAVARARALRTELEQSPGSVFAWQRPWWNVLAGGQGHVGAMGMHDIWPAQRRQLQRDVVAALQSGRFEVVWLEGPVPAWMASVLRTHYRVSARRVGTDRVRPMTGFMSEAGMVTAYRAAQLRYERIHAQP